MARKKKTRRNEKGQGSFRYKENSKVEYRFSYKDEFGVSHTLDNYTDIFKSMDNGALGKFDAYINAM